MFSHFCCACRLSVALYRAMGGYVLRWGNGGPSLGVGSEIPEEGGEQGNVDLAVLSAYF